MLRSLERRQIELIAPRDSVPSMSQYLALHLLVVCSIVGGL
jgi:hypothetical protein